MNEACDLDSARTRVEGRIDQAHLRISRQLIGFILKAVAGRDLHQRDVRIGQGDVPGTAGDSEPNTAPLSPRRDRCVRGADDYNAPPSFCRAVSSAVEQVAFNHLVDGSNPSRPTTSLAPARRPHR